MTDFHGPMEPNDDFEIQWQSEAGQGRCLIRPRDCPLGQENWWERLATELPGCLMDLTPLCRRCRKQGRTMPYPCGRSWRSTFQASYLWETGTNRRVFMGFTCDKCGARSPIEQERAMAWAEEHASGCRRIEW